MEFNNLNNQIDLPLSVRNKIGEYDYNRFTEFRDAYKDNWGWDNGKEIINDIIRFINSFNATEKK